MVFSGQKSPHPAETKTPPKRISPLKRCLWHWLSLVKLFNGNKDSPRKLTNIFRKINGWTPFCWEGKFFLVITYTPPQNWHIVVSKKWWSVQMKLPFWNGPLFWELVYFRGGYSWDYSERKGGRISTWVRTHYPMVEMSARSFWCVEIVWWICKEKLWRIPLVRTQCFGLFPLPPANG